MDEIWGMDTEADERTVAVHIKRLREKFTDLTEFKIVTIRGLGYKAEKEELLEQVWLNLIDNAIKFSSINVKISIRLNQTANAVIVQIHDHGIGMSDETITRIFEKFYQGDKTRSHEGSGLGLSLVKRILDLYGAKIQVESKLHVGSTFTVELPL